MTVFKYFKSLDFRLLQQPQLYYLSASGIVDKKGFPELQISISFNYPKYAIESYKETWQIESMVKAFKTSRFNIERTHLSDINRLKNCLLSSLSLLYGLIKLDCYYIKEIRLLKRGNLAKSFVKHGLEYIATMLLNANYQ